MLDNLIKNNEQHKINSDIKKPNIIYSRNKLKSYRFKKYMF